VSQLGTENGVRNHFQLGIKKSTLNFRTAMVLKVP
jgi:hypothetical protein